MKRAALVAGILSIMACSTPDHEADAPVEVAAAGPRVAGADRAAAIAYVAAHRADFGIRDVDADLRVERVDADTLGMTHVRLEQVHHGLRVVGGEMLVHADAAGRVTSVASTFVPGIDLDVAPSLTPSQAVEAAVAHAAQRLVLAPQAFESNTAPELVVHVTGEGASALGYTMKLRVRGAAPTRVDVTVDAVTGRVLELYEDLHRVQGSGIGVLGDRKSLEVASRGSGYALEDTSRAVGVETYTAEGNLVGTVDGAKVVTSNVTDAWDTVGPGAGAAVDAHAHGAIVVDYYAARHGRRGFDGLGAPLRAVVHYGRSYDNAFWDPDTEEMSFGDGAQLFKPLSAALDVVAHEFTHGVTAATSRLRYRGQSGALNEAMSDIFGAFVEHAARPDAERNWQIGEDVARAAGLLRDFRDPRRGGQPAHMSEYVQTQQDGGGVHINSGIINHAAFLMTAGGRGAVSGIEVKTPIGWEKAEKLWYRANTTYFLSETTFALAGPALVEAARDLGFSADERVAVETALVAVGLSPTLPLGPAPKRSPDTPRGELPQRNGVAAGAEPEVVGPRGTRRAAEPAIGCSSARIPPGPRGLGLVVFGALVALVVRRRARRREAA
ncbi:MAG: peptidase M4 family protein [Deltaproteobacteria bacterium]|nr:peptidase M4 family protein [Deltaproteobacteria bacterium]